MLLNAFLEVARLYQIEGHGGGHAATESLLQEIRDKYGCFTEIESVQHLIDRAGNDRFSPRGRSRHSRKPNIAEIRVALSNESVILTQRAIFAARLNHFEHLVSWGVESTSVPPPRKLPLDPGVDVMAVISTYAGRRLHNRQHHADEEQSSLHEAFSGGGGGGGSSSGHGGSGYSDAGFKKVDRLPCSTAGSTIQYAVELAASLHSKGPDVMPDKLFTECIDVLAKEQAWSSLDDLYSRRRQNQVDDGEHNGNTAGGGGGGGDNDATSSSGGVGDSSSVSRDGPNDVDERMEVLAATGALDLRDATDSRGMAIAIVRAALKEVRKDLLKHQRSGRDRMFSKVASFFGKAEPMFGDGEPAWRTGNVEIWVDLQAELHQHPGTAPLVFNMLSSLNPPVACTVESKVCDVTTPPIHFVSCELQGTGTGGVRRLPFMGGLAHPTSALSVRQQATSFMLT